MELRYATGKDKELIEFITRKTIEDIYPHYYARGAVDFFLSHHSSERILEDIQAQRVVLLYTDSQEAVGTVTIKNNEICRLFVLPQYQKNGYGKKLIEFAEEVISRQYDMIQLAASLPAKAIYLHRGYVEVESHVIPTDNGDYLCYDVMQKPAMAPRYKISYDGKCFVSSDNSKNGEVDVHTLFHYHQKGTMIWAEYAGGKIRKGTLIGTVDPQGKLCFYYQHLNEKDCVRIGKCQSIPVILENGKIELHEKWKWLNGDESEGESVITER